MMAGEHQIETPNRRRWHLVSGVVVFVVTYSALVVAVKVIAL